MYNKRFGENKMFVVVEGIDGSGKTTLLKQLLTNKSRLKENNLFLCAEKNSTDFCRDVNRTLTHNTDVDIYAKMLTYVAARADNIKKNIVPNLDKLIVCDRYIPSTYAYQCGGERLKTKFVRGAHKLLPFVPEPDAIILLDADSKTCVHRHDSYERNYLKNLMFYERVRKYYLKLAKKQLDIYHVVDAKQSKEAVLVESLAIINGLKNKNE